MPASASQQQLRFYARFQPKQRHPLHSHNQYTATTTITSPSSSDQLSFAQLVTENAEAGKILTRDLSSDPQALLTHLESLLPDSNSSKRHPVWRSLQRFVAHFSSNGSSYVLQHVCSTTTTATTGCALRHGPDDFFASFQYVVPPTSQGPPGGPSASPRAQASGWRATFSRAPNGLLTKGARREDCIVHASTPQPTASIFVRDFCRVEALFQLLQSALLGVLMEIARLRLDIDSNEGRQYALVTTANIAPRHAYDERDPRAGMKLAKVRPDVALMPRQAQSDSSQLWGDVLAVFEYKRSSAKPLEEHQLAQYLTSALSSLPAFVSLYGALIDPYRVNVFFVNSDQITKLASFDPDAEPTRLYEFSTLLLALCLDNKTGYRSFRRHIDLTAFRHLFIQKAPVAGAESSIAKGLDKIELVSPPPPTVPLPRPAAMSASSARSLAPAANSTPVAQWFWWYRGLPAHRYTAVAYAMIKFPDSDPSCWAVLKLSHLKESAWHREGEMLARLGRHRQTLEPTTPEMRFALSRFSCLPDLVAAGPLFVSAQEAKVSYVYQRIGTVRDLSRRGLVLDPAQGLVTLRSDQGRQPVAVVTRYDPAKPTFELGTAHPALLPAIIACVIETLHCCCSPAGVAHCDVSSQNIRWTPLSPEQIDLLRLGTSDAMLRPSFGHLIDFGEARTATEHENRGGDLSSSGEPADLSELLRYISGTRLYWPVRSYKNLQILEELKVNRFDDPSYGGQSERADLLALRTMDDIESALLVLAFESSRIYDLADYPSKGLRVPRARRWADASPERLESMFEDARKRNRSIKYLFQDPRLEPGHPTRCAVPIHDTAHKVLDIVRNGLLRCFALCDAASVDADSSAFWNPTSSSSSSGGGGGGGEVKHDVAPSTAATETAAVALDVDALLDTLYGMTRELLLLETEEFDSGIDVAVVLNAVDKGGEASGGG